MGPILNVGFSCNPNPPSHPPPHTHTIVGKLSFAHTQIIVGNCIEHFVTKYQCAKSPFKPLGEAGASKFCPTVPAWVARTGFHLRWYIIGLLISLIITDSAKIVVGRLRPNFIDVCKPNFSQFNCTDEYNNPVYVTNYVCTGDQSMVPDTRYATYIYV